MEYEALRPQREAEEASRRAAEAAAAEAAAAVPLHEENEWQIRSGLRATAGSSSHREVLAKWSGNYLY